MDKSKRLITLSLITSLVLMLVKFVAYFLTSSNAVFTDAAESIVNVAAGAFAFYSVHLSSRPRDKNHPYGHGKIEFFSVFIEGGLILIAGGLVLVKALYNLFFPEELEHVSEGMWLIAITALVNFVVGGYIKTRGKALHSLAVEADGKHLQVDAYSTLIVVVGLLIIKYTGFVLLDVILSIALGVFILVNGYGMLRKSIGGLMDESDEALVEKVIQVLNDNRKDPWIDVHNLRVLRYGSQLHIDCHLTLPWYYNLEQVHVELLSIEKAMNDQIEMSTELFVHADPCIPSSCAHCHVKNCPVRTAEFRETIEWTLENVTMNKKHIHPSIESDREIDEESK